MNNLEFDKDTRKYSFGEINSTLAEKLAQKVEDILVFIKP